MAVTMPFTYSGRVVGLTHRAWEMGEGSSKRSGTTHTLFLALDTPDQLGDVLALKLKDDDMSVAVYNAGFGAQVLATGEARANDRKQIDLKVDTLTPAKPLAAAKAS